MLNRLGTTLAGRALPDRVFRRNGRVRLVRPATDYAGLADAMFHMLRRGAAGQPAVKIRVLEVMAGVEPHPARRAVLARHAALARRAALRETADPAARSAIRARCARYTPSRCALRSAPSSARSSAISARMAASCSPTGSSSAVPSP